ncbi:MAG: hypothetical protein QM784_33225 [Polyangiaceae bacterium]
MQDERNSEAPIALCRDLTQFFGEIVTTVKQRRAYDASDATATYIAALLADHANGVMPMGAFDKPLTLQLADALNQVGTERFARLRRIGDGILYTTGFFGEHLERRGIEQSYVEELGARAYATAGKMMVIDRAQANSLFDELAQGFHMFVALVHEVADSLRAGAARTESAVLELYERWLSSRSESLASALASRGLVPLRGTGTLQ